MLPLPASLPGFNVDVSIVIDGESVAACIKNISTKGASILTKRPISATKQIALTIYTPSRGQFDMLGTTVYSFETEQNIFETGIRLQALTAETAKFVTEAMLRMAQKGAN